MKRHHVLPDSVLTYVSPAFYGILHPVKKVGRGVTARCGELLYLKIIIVGQPAYLAVFLFYGFVQRDCLRMIEYSPVVPLLFCHVHARAKPLPFAVGCYFNLNASCFDIGRSLSAVKNHSYCRFHCQVLKRYISGTFLVHRKSVPKNVPKYTEIYGYVWRFAEINFRIGIDVMLCDSVR